MTDNSLERWVRPRFVPLPLNALTFFVIYGNLEDAFPPIPREVYRSGGLPAEMELGHHGLDLKPELLSHFQKGMGWEAFCRESPATVLELKKSNTCLALRGDLPDADNLDQLRDCIGLIMYLLDNGGVAVCDVLTGTWYSPLDWRVKIFEEGMPAVGKLVNILSTEQPDNKRRLYTSGMRRFARPDLSMENITLEQESSSLTIIRFLVQALIEGGSIPNGQQLNFSELNTSITSQWQGGVDDPLFYNFWLQLQRIA